MNTRNKYQSLSDAELLLQYRSTKDKKIIGELYGRYGHLVFGIGLKYFKNKNDAEDIVMDVFMTLDKKIEKHEIKYFKSWLYMVTKNSCLLVLRKNNPHSVPINEEIITSESMDNAIEEKKITESKIEKLEETIKDLNPPQDKVITLFYIQKLTYKEISEQLSISIKKVKSAIQNGKRNLKIKLKEHDLFKSA